ncbi:MAG: polysaccharide pyruvyl transferase family protein [Coriobacteriia bacterium]|nr:polysaccharide pyruvyl transferase family protein [Coriobacteriia bacterium]
MARVGITGSYGGCNLGDEAILASMVTQLRASLPGVEISVFTPDPEDTLTRHGVERAPYNVGVGRDDLLSEIEGLDLLIVGGGGILYDYWLQEHLREMQLALEAGVRVMVYAVGVGPLADSSIKRALTQALLQADAITVRDLRSRHALEKLGVDGRVLVTADPALLLKPEPLPDDALTREGLTDKERVVGMSVREPGPAAPDIDVEVYHAQLAGAADYMIERFDADVVFVPLEPQVQDVRHSHAVISKMQRPQRASVLKGEYSSQQLLSLVRHLNFAVGMRLHFLIFAALQRVPFVALPYASKVMGFVEELQMETPPLQNLSIGQLLAYIDRSWDRQEALRSLVDRGLPQLQERARDNNRLVIQVLEGVVTSTEKAGAAP